MRLWVVYAKIATRSFRRIEVFPGRHFSRAFIFVVVAPTWYQELRLLLIENSEWKIHPSVVYQVYVHSGIQRNSVVMLHQYHGISKHHSGDK